MNIEAKIEIGNFCLNGEVFDSREQRCGHVPTIDESSIVYNYTKATFIERCNSWHEGLLLGEPAFSGEAGASVSYFCGEKKNEPVFIKTADFVCKLGRGDDGYSVNEKVIEWVPIADPKSLVTCDGVHLTPLKVQPDL